MPDSLLLRPESQVVPFHRYRYPLRQTVLDWALKTEMRIALRLHVGPGGAGKTRLMIAACDVLETEHGWLAGFLRAEKNKDLERDFREILSKPGDRFIVLDYAETRSQEIAALARTALHHPSVRGKVRIALLARDSGDWWDHLADAAAGDKILAALLSSPATKAGPYRMTGERLPPETRQAVYAEALEAFASEKKLPYSTRPAPDLDAEAFGDVLFIHLAALNALRGRPTAGDIELLDACLGHERSYWRHLLDKHGLDDSALGGIEQALALLTLCGGAREAKGARDVLSQTPRLRHAPASVREEIFGLLRRLYRQDGGLDGMKPDLLGERLLAQALDGDDELLDIALNAAAPPERARHALTVLTRLAGRFPAEGKWLELALKRHLAARSIEALAVGMETGVPMPEMLAEAIGAAVGTTRRTVVNAIRQKLPKGTRNLNFLAVEVSKQHLQFVQEKHKGKNAGAMLQLFAALKELAERLKDSGWYGEAVGALESALRHARHLARSGKPEDQQRLAITQNLLASVLAESDQFAAALEHARESERVVRELLKAPKQKIYQPLWATTLYTLSVCRGKLGSFEEAVETGRRSEAIFGELVKRHPDAYRKEWAASLYHLAYQLDELGRFDDALAKAEQSETVFAELAERYPDIFRNDLAFSQQNVAFYLAELGRFDDALEKAERSEAILRELAEQQPDANRADWGRALNNVAYYLNELGRFDESLIKAELAEAALREAAERRPNAYRAEWANSLGNIAMALIGQGRPDDALKPAELAAASLPVSGDAAAIDLHQFSYRQAILARAYLESGDAKRALDEARRAHDLLLGQFDRRPAYVARKLADLLPVLARCEDAAAGRQEATRTLLDGIERLAPYFREWPQTLRRREQALVDELRRLAPERVADVSP